MSATSTRHVFVLSLLFVLIVAAVPALAGDPHNQIRARGWVQMLPPVIPPPRADTAMAYDTDRGVAILFGGYDGQEFGDHWEWESASMTWIEQQPTTSPSPRYGHAMAYDEARGVTVLFGGIRDTGFFSNETWEYDAAAGTWEQRLPASHPTARWLHRMYYDPVRQKVVLVGGDPWDSWGSDQTWEYDGVTWVQRTDIAPFTARFNMGLAYDPVRDITVIFAGDDGIGLSYFNDVWERAGDGDWVQVIPPVNPERRQSVSGGYLPRVGRSIFYGGYNSSGMRLGDTLVWGGNQWQKPNPPVHPTGSSSAMVYDTVNQGLLLYVGLSADNYLVGETWYLR